MKVKNVGLLIVLLIVAFVASCSKNDCIAKTKESCVVTFELNRVCGCNGVTYPNPSTAECNNIDDYTMGACN